MSGPDEDRLVVFDDDFEVLPDTTADERGAGWGEADGGHDDRARLEELRREVPPHWA